MSERRSGITLVDILKGTSEESLATMLADPEKEKARERTRPRQYSFSHVKREAYIEAIRERGMKRNQAARSIQVNPSTITRYIQDNPEFQDEVDRAELESIHEVERSLFLAAVEDRDVRAMEVFLYNRAPERWQNKKTVQKNINIHRTGSPDLAIISPESLSDPETRRLHTRLLYKLVGHGTGEAESSGLGDSPDERRESPLLALPPPSVT